MAAFPRKFLGKSASKAASRAAARSRASRRFGAGLRLESLEQRVLLDGSGFASTAPATHFALWAPENVTAGASEPLELVALDAANHVAGNYAGTVHVESGDANAVLPDDYTFTAADHGRRLFQMTLNTVGQETVTATDTADATITGSITLNVTPAPVATHFGVWAPETSTDGTSFSTVVVALDAANHPVWNYTGTVQLTSSDASASLPDAYTFTAADHGVHAFQVTLNSSGSQTITATDTADDSITGEVTVNADPAQVATHFGVWAAENVTAGKSFGTVVVALDAANHPVWNYTGTVQLSSSDGSAVLPDSYAFTAADHGFHIFQTTLNTTGSQTVTATDTTTDTIVGSVTVNVNPAPVATHFAVFAREDVTAGAPSSVVVVALDASNHVVPNYTGTVQLSADGDPNAVLPDAYTFTASDRGRHVFQVTLNTTGALTIVATDTTTATVTGTITVNVNPAPVATHFAVWAEEHVTAGVPFKLVVVALDASNHVVPNYTGTVQLSDDGDPNAVLPDAYTFTASDHGRHAFQVTLNTAGSQTISVADANNAALTGTITVMVSAPPSTRGGSGSGGGFFHGPNFGGHDAFFAGFAGAARSWRRWR